MPAGHTDRATINARRPITKLMRGLLEDINFFHRINEPMTAKNMDNVGKNLLRALMDRGLVTFAGSNTDPISLTETGEAELKKGKSK